MPAPARIKATLTGLQKFGSDVFLYTFGPEDRVPRYRPGQFLHLALDPYDPSFEWPESRVFSIAGDSRETIRIIVSVKGSFTRRMARELHKGSKVWLKLPYGDFTFRDSGNKLVFVAGGTGIAPFISFLENLRNTGNNHRPVRLYYGVRDKVYFAFKEQLQEFESCIPGFECIIYNQNQDEDPVEGARPGMLDIRKIISENEKTCDFYLSGPFEMVKIFENSLSESGIGESNIFIDEW